MDDAKKSLSLPGKNQPQVVLPRPSETRLMSEPSARMTNCSSQVRPSRVDWNVIQRASGLQYASAFSPPKVSCRMLERRVSPASGATVTADVDDDRSQAAAPMSATAQKKRLDIREGGESLGLHQSRRAGTAGAVLASAMSSAVVRPFLRSSMARVSCTSSETSRRFQVESPNARRAMRSESRRST